MVPKVSTPKILAVDDNKQNLDVLTKALTAAQYDIITATDGPTALKLVETDSPDLILLDVLMPGMSGYEVCEKIRANETAFLEGHEFSGWASTYLVLAM